MFRKVLVANRGEIPDSLIGFLRGELGTPAAGWPGPFRAKALRGRGPAKPETPLSPVHEAGLAGSSADRRATLNRLLFPGPTKEFLAHRETYGDTSGLTRGEERRVHLEKVSRC
jgi:pyruvate carboxylase